MLYLSRKLGESIVINNTIELTVVEVRGKTVKLGFVFPPEATVLRKEIYDKVHAENINAAGSGDDSDFMEGDFDLTHLDNPREPLMAEPPKVDIQEDPARPLPEKPAVQKAVAVEYDRGVDNAPRVTASGSGSIAEQILQIAFERGIKVREDAELVEILSLVEVDSPIPLEAFAAVAEILAHVYNANAAAKQRVVWKS